MAISYFLTGGEGGDAGDPLGLAEIHRELAGRLVPGVACTATSARALALICAATGSGGAGVLQGTPRRQRERRRDALLAAERYVALALELAAGREPAPIPTAAPGPGASEVPEDADRPHERLTRVEPERPAELADSGRSSGIGFPASARAAARAHLEQLGGGVHVNARFRLLPHQESQGIWGTHHETAVALGLLTDELIPTASRGVVLGRAFLEATGAPADLAVALKDPERPLPLADLAAWGARLGESISRSEAAALAAALFAHPRRARLSRGLADRPREPGEPELIWLARVASALDAPTAKGSAAHGKGTAAGSLVECIALVMAFETVHVVLSLGLARLAWVCERSPDGAVELVALAGDPVLRRVRRELPAATRFLVQQLERMTDPWSCPELSGLSDYLREACTACDAEEGVAQALVARHRAALRRSPDAEPWFVTPVPGRIGRSAGAPGARPDEVQAPSELPPHRYATEALAHLAGAARAFDLENS